MIEFVLEALQDPIGRQRRELAVEPAFEFGFQVSPIMRAMPSDVFNMTLPTKPSHTTTSVVPL